MRIAIVDESAARASIIEEGLAELDGCEIFVLTERAGLVARIGEIAPDIVLIDLGNPSRDVLEEYFAVSRVLARPIAMFVDESDEDAIAASIDAGVSAYVVDGFPNSRFDDQVDALSQLLAHVRDREWDVRGTIVGPIYLENGEWVGGVGLPDNLRPSFNL